MSNILKITDSELTLTQFVDMVTAKLASDPRISLEVSNVVLSRDPESDAGWSTTQIVIAASAALLVCLGIVAYLVRSSQRT